MSILFVGLDVETSGLDVNDGARLIQIGLAISSGMFSSHVNPGTLSWSEKSEEVHKIPKESLLNFPDPEIVDLNCYEFLKNIGADFKSRHNLVAVGWNVGAFDMPFVKQSLPKLYSLFSRRTVDLNALCFALDGKLENDTPVSFNQWKSRAKQYATEVIGFENAHDAGWDALMSIHCFNYLRYKMS